MISAVGSWVLPSLAWVSALTLVAWHFSALALVMWPLRWSQDTPLTWLAHLGILSMVASGVALVLMTPSPASPPPNRLTEVFVTMYRYEAAIDLTTGEADVST
jgi:hypothetical protein